MATKPILLSKINKYNDFDKLAPYMPKRFARYYEPFLCGMLYRLQPEQATISIDDRHLFSFYRSLLHNSKSVRRELQRLQEDYAVNARHHKLLAQQYPSKYIPDLNKDMYEDMVNDFNGISVTGLHFATVFYFLYQMSNHVRFNYDHELITDYDTDNPFRDRLTKGQIKLLQRTEIVHEPYLKSFKQASPDDFMFLAPDPYLTTQYQRKCLAHFFRKLSANAMLVVHATNQNRHYYGNLIRGTYTNDHNMELFVITNYKFEKVD